jgi:hypothetical protein
MAEIPKPFGLPDEHGFYQVHSSNRLALSMAHNLVEIWSSSLECLALSGYIERDYPENTPEEEYDWKYHLLIGVDQNLSESARRAFLTSDLNKQFQQAYDIARDGMYWNHGPVRMVTVDYDALKEELFPGTLLFSLVCSAVPLWEKPEVKKSWEERQLSPFEHLQQYFFQFHTRPEREEAVYVSRVTGDEADRFILFKE